MAFSGDLFQLSSPQEPYVPLHSQREGRLTVRPSQMDGQLSAPRSSPDFAPRSIDPVVGERHLVGLPATECEPGLLRWQQPGPRSEPS